jgi:hypothetical protein
MEIWKKGIAATQPASGLLVRFSGGRARGMHSFGLRAPRPPSLGSASESLPPPGSAFAGSETQRAGRGALTAPPKAR